MEKKGKFRVLIKHYVLREKKTITEIKAKLDKYYRDSAPFISMVKKWFIEFRCGHTSTIDAERCRRPVEVAVPETIEKIRNMLLADQRLQVREIVEAIGISYGCFDFERSLGYKKAIRKMGVVFAHNRP